MALRGGDGRIGIRVALDGFSPMCTARPSRQLLRLSKGSRQVCLSFDKPGWRKKFPPVMVVGACKVTLRLPENASLKGKRQLVLSLSQRLHNKFNVAVAEIGDNDRWQIATLGITCVSNDGRHAREQLDDCASRRDKRP